MGRRVAAGSGFSGSIPISDRRRSLVKPMARQAFLHWTKTLRNREVEIVFDELKFDSRAAPAYLQKDGADVGLEMIAGGLALAYTKYPSPDESLSPGAGKGHAGQGGSLGGPAAGPPVQPAEDPLGYGKDEGRLTVYRILQLFLRKAGSSRRRTSGEGLRVLRAATSVRGLGFCISNFRENRT